MQDETSHWPVVAGAWKLKTNLFTIVCLANEDGHGDLTRDIVWQRRRRKFNLVIRIISKEERETQDLGIPAAIMSFNWSKDIGQIPLQFSFQREMVAQHPSEIPSNSINDNQVYNTSCRFNEAAAADQQNPAGKDKERAGRQPGCGHLLRSFVFVRQTLPQVRGGRGVSNSDVSHVLFFPFLLKRRSTDHGTVPNGFAFFFSVHTNITHAHTHTEIQSHDRPRGIDQ